MMPDTADSSRAGEHLQDTRLLIVERHVLLAEAIAAAAGGAGYGETRVVSDAAMALRIMQTSPPDIVLANLGVVAGDGFDFLTSISGSYPETRVVLIVDDAHDQREAVDALVAGADGLVYRSQGITSLLRVLDVVRRGETAIPRHLTGLILETLRLRPPQHPGMAQLSARQREVLKLVAQGLTDRDISEELHISMTTVRSHLRAIFEKTGTGNRTAAALWAGAHLPDLDP